MGGLSKREEEKKGEVRGNLLDIPLENAFLSKKFLCKKNKKAEIFV